MLSFVVPVLNEEDGIIAFYEELLKVIPSLDKEYEIIFIDDGSTDTSLELLKDLENKNKHVKVFSFRRNMGKSEALTFGFMKAKGDYIVTLDADLQDRPTEIHKLLKKCKEGTEVVTGFRQNQKRQIYMIGISKIFNWTLRLIFDLQIHDYNCGLKVFTKDAAKSLRLYGGLHRFIPLLSYEQGFTVDEVPVEHDLRKFGKSKYGFSKLWRDLPDMFTMIFLTKYSKRPLHFFGIIGGVFILIGSVILINMAILHYLGYSISRRPILFLGMLLEIAGLQVFFTGFLADLMINISHTPRMLDEENLHFPLKYSSDKIHRQE